MTYKIKLKKMDKVFVSIAFRTVVKNILLMGCALFFFGNTVQGQRKKKFRTSRNIEITANKSDSITLTANNANDISIVGPKAKVNINPPKSIPITELWFKHNGQLYSNPPEVIYSGEKVVAKVTIDDKFWYSRINIILSSWISTLEKLKNYVKDNEFIKYGITETELQQLEEEMAYKLDQFINKSSFPYPELKNFYTTKLNLLGIKTTAKPGADQLTPDIDDLIKPEYSIEYYFYDNKKVRMNSDGTIYCAGDKTSSKFKPCDANKAVGMYMADEIAVPPNCYEFNYELRLANNINNVTIKWTDLMISKFPSEEYAKIVKAVLKKLDDDYIKKVTLLSKDVEKLSINPLDPSVNIEDQLAFTKEGRKFTEKIINDLIQMKVWVLRWLWLTNGVPKVNPFESGILFSEGVQGKVSKQNRALYQIFENMVNKGAIKMENLNALDSNIIYISKIKAELDAEVAQQPNEPQQQDRLLYHGQMKSTSGTGKIFMRHIDLANNNAIMGNKPVKEITENDRMYILAENRPATLKLNSSFETFAVGPEDSWLTEAIKLTNTAADKGPSNIKTTDSTKMERISKVESVLIPEAARFLKEISMLKKISQMPVLPIIYEKDQTPDLVTYNVVHDYLYQAPVTAKYSLKQVNPDDTEKELVNGTYRINKLYRFRLKAGLTYSFLKKTDYTEITPNEYTLDDSRFGIDGTFGIQTFFKPQDIRSDKPGFRSFVYVGFSMKKISENFYIGLGSEPFSGITIGINGHIGKREALVGSSTSTSIKSTWGVGIAPTILIDPSLFIRLFTFGNTNRTLLNF